MSKTFVLTGLAGFVAPRHLRAIKEIGGELVAALDPHDSVGIVDQFFPNCEFFTNVTEFEHYCTDSPPDFFVICSPNYLHASQTQFALYHGMDVICEKPVALTSKELDGIKKVEIITGKQISSILQLRLKPELQGLKCEIEQSKEYHRVDLEYQTPRGAWYYKSWKGSTELSGGLSTNIGVHLADLLIWFFGKEEKIKIWTKTDSKVEGELFFRNAHVHFILSIEGHEPIRRLAIGKREIEFSKGFSELHTLSYQKILEGKGFGLGEASPSILLCEKIRAMNSGETL